MIWLGPFIKMTCNIHKMVTYEYAQSLQILNLNSTFSQIHRLSANCKDNVPSSYNYQSKTYYTLALHNFFSFLRNMNWNNCFLSNVSRLNDEDIYGCFRYFDFANDHIYFASASVDSTFTLNVAVPEDDSKESAYVKSSLAKYKNKDSICVPPIPPVP